MGNAVAGDGAGAPGNPGLAVRAPAAPAAQPGAATLGAASDRSTGRGTGVLARTAESTGTAFAGHIASAASASRRSATEVGADPHAAPLVVRRGGIVGKTAATAPGDANCGPADAADACRVGWRSTEAGATAWPLAVRRRRDDYLGRGRLLDDLAGEPGQGGY